MPPGSRIRLPGRPHIRPPPRTRPQTRRSPPPESGDGLRTRQVLNGSGGEDRLVPQLGDGVPLDLTNALGGDSPDGADVGELGLATVEQTVAATDHVRG